MVHHSCPLPYFVFFLGTLHVTCNICIMAGVHTAVYHARPLDEDGGIVFTKIRQTKALENADQGQTKVYEELQ